MRDEKQPGRISFLPIRDKKIDFTQNSNNSLRIPLKIKRRGRSFHFSKRKSLLKSKDIFSSLPSALEELSTTSQNRYHKKDCHSSIVEDFRPMDVRKLNCMPSSETKQKLDMMISMYNNKYMITNLDMFPADEHKPKGKSWNLLK